METDGHKIVGEDNETMNIQIGIVIPPVSQVTSKKKKDDIKSREKSKNDVDGREGHEKENTEAEMGFNDGERRIGRSGSLEKSRENGSLKRSRVVFDGSLSAEAEEGDKKKRKTEKNKKRKKNKAKKKSSGASDEMETDTTHQHSAKLDREACLDYLRKWDSDKSSWSFRKKVQYWLLQNACDKTQIPKKEFKIFLHYIEGLQGNQRRVCVARMKSMVEQYQVLNEEEGTETHAEGRPAINKSAHRRAVKILKIIT